MTTLDNEQVLAILALSKDATAIFSTADLNISFANDAMLSYWGKSKDVIGTNLGEAMPELEGQGFLDLLKSVWLSGETYKSKTLAARVFEDSILQTRYFDFTHRALLNSEKITYAILTTATQIPDGQITADLLKSNKKTEKKLHQQLFDANQEYKTTTEELHLSNNELFRLRKEVEAANQLLKLANRGLKEDNTKLTASERKALEIFSGAPIAIGVLTGKEMLIETANLMLLEIWGAPLTVIGKKLSAAIPELTGQRFLKLLDTVFATGKAFYSANEVLFLKRNGKMSEGYYNFVYHPLKNEFGETESIMLVANEVTERVRATQLVQTLNGDLAEINKELRMINEQVNSANEKAESSNNQLNLANEELV
ncbi:MAG: PAS domain-containing protein, partial [Pedobacter sp.]|nr:PAS domain-containing protein [Pedobacter sp.]